MVYNETTKRKNMEYLKKSQKRIDINWLKSDFDEYVMPAIQKTGKPVSTFIKQAVQEKIERDNLDDKKILPELQKILKNMNITDQKKVLDVIKVIMR